MYLRYKNWHISPTEIENIVQEHPNVAESQVFGKKDPSVQELVSIAVVPKENKHVMLNIQLPKIKCSILLNY